MQETVFEMFAQKAAKRLEERKKRRRETLRIKNLDDMELEIRGLSDVELNECMEFSDVPVEVDKYTMYMASRTLQETAKLLVAKGVLQPTKEYKITEMFSAAERRFIVERILILSGTNETAQIEVIEESKELKNS